MNTIKIDGQLEVDPQRGVIYFHAFETGHTCLRICKLPTPIPTPDIDRMLDITFGYGCSWDKDTIHKAHNKIEWTELPGDKYIVIGESQYGEKFRTTHYSWNYLQHCNFYRARIWLVRNGKRKLIKTVIN